MGALLQLVILLEPQEVELFTALLQKFHSSKKPPVVPAPGSPENPVLSINIPTTLQPTLNT